jgi:hypothetical protein
VQNAKAVAETLVDGNCELAHAQVFVTAVTQASYTNVQGCAQTDSSSGNASGSTGGSTAEAVRSHSDTVLLHRLQVPSPSWLPLCVSGPLVATLDRDDSLLLCVQISLSS